MAKNCVKTALLVLLICIGFTKTQAQQGADIESLAIDYYNEQEFKKAIPLFSDLLAKYPKNELLNYYFGSTKVYLNNFNEDVTDAFLVAQEGDVPIDVHYFTGKNYHALNEFDLAIQSYESYIRLAKKKDRKATDVAEMTSLAYEGVNPFAPREDFENTATPENKTTSSGIVLARPGEKVNFDETAGPAKTPVSTTTKAQTSIVLAEPGKKVSFEDTHVSSDVRKEPVTKPKETALTTTATSADSKSDNVTSGDDPQSTVEVESYTKETIKQGVEITFRINNQLLYTYSGQFRDEEAAKKFEEGWNAKKERESLSQQADQLRKQYGKESNPESRDQIARKILDYEQRTFPLIRKEETAFSSAQDLEEVYWSRKPEPEVLAYAKLIESLDEVEEEEEPALAIEESEPAVERDVEIETVPSQNTPKKMEVSNEVVYRIQIGAYKNTPPDYVLKQHKKLSMLRKIDKYVDNKGVTVYTVGNTDSYASAATLQKQVRQEGMKDAFVAAYLNGERIAISKAKELEQK